VYGETEEELLANAKKHGMRAMDMPKRLGMRKFQEYRALFVG
jgi:hypothetical protein